MCRWSVRRDSKHHVLGRRPHAYAWRFDALTNRDRQEADR
jgi:hypothetical protein